MAMNYQDLGNRIRHTRKHLGMTQEQLAEKVGISASFLGHIERGTRVASLETLISFCNVLQVQSDYLLAASLNTYDSYMPANLTQQTRSKLNEFLRLAQDTISNWND